VLTLALQADEYAPLLAARNRRMRTAVQTTLSAARRMPRVLAAASSGTACSCACHVTPRLRAASASRCRMEKSASEAGDVRTAIIQQLLKHC